MINTISLYKKIGYILFNPKYKTNILYKLFNKNIIRALLHLVSTLLTKRNCELMLIKGITKCQ